MKKLFVFLFLLSSVSFVGCRRKPCTGVSSEASKSDHIPDRISTLVVTDSGTSKDNPNLTVYKVTDYDGGKFGYCAEHNTFEVGDSLTLVKK